MTSPDFGAIDALLQSPEAAALGGSVLVVRDSSGIIFERSYHGFALDQRENLASATKWLVATLLLRLCGNESLGLGLDDPVQQHIPEWGRDDPAKARITLRRLLSHTSGLPGSSEFVDRQDITLAEGALAIGALPLVFEPGSQFHYGECGMQVAGLIAERVTGLPFVEAFERYLTQPLGLQNLSFADAHGALPQNSHLGAGVYGTAQEYSVVLQALLSSFSGDATEPFLPRVLLQEMFSDQTAGIRLPFDYTPYIYVKALANSRYGLGCWREEAGPLTGALIRAGSMGRWGASPWINLRQRHCGILLLKDDYLLAIPLYLQLQELLEKALG